MIVCESLLGAGPPSSRLSSVVASAGGDGAVFRIAGAAGDGPACELHATLLDEHSGFVLPVEPHSAFASSARIDAVLGPDAAAPSDALQHLFAHRRQLDCVFFTLRPDTAKHAAALSGVLDAMERHRSMQTGETTFFVRRPTDVRVRQTADGDGAGPSSISSDVQGPGGEVHLALEDAASGTRLGELVLRRVTPDEYAQLDWNFRLPDKLESPLGPARCMLMRCSIPPSIWPLRRRLLQVLAATYGTVHYLSQDQTPGDLQDYTARDLALDEFCAVPPRRNERHETRTLFCVHARRRDYRALVFAGLSDTSVAAISELAANPTTHYTALTLLSAPAAAAASTARSAVLTDTLRENGDALLRGLVASGQVTQVELQVKRIGRKAKRVEGDSANRFFPYDELFLCGELERGSDADYCRRRCKNGRVAALLSSLDKDSPAATDALRVPASLAAAVNEASLIFNERVIVNEGFRTNDPAVWAAGECARFSRRYAHDINEICEAAFSGAEMGVLLAQMVAEGTGFSAKALLARQLRPKRPQITACSFPGAAGNNAGSRHLLELSLPLFRETARTITTDLGESAFTQLSLDANGFICAVAYFGDRPPSLTRYLHLLGAHERRLANLEQRVTDGVVTDISAWVEESAFAPLFDERALIYFERLKEEMMAEPSTANERLQQTLRELSASRGGSGAKLLDDDARAAIFDEFSSGPDSTRGVWLHKMQAFVEANFAQTR